MYKLSIYVYFSGQEPVWSWFFLPPSSALGMRYWTWCTCFLAQLTSHNLLQYIFLRVRLACLLLRPPSLYVDWIVMMFVLYDLIKRHEKLSVVECDDIDGFGIDSRGEVDFGQIKQIVSQSFKFGMFNLLNFENEIWDMVVSWSLIPSSFHLYYCVFAESRSDLHLSWLGNFRSRSSIKINFLDYNQRYGLTEAHSLRTTIIQFH